MWREVILLEEMIDAAEQAIVLASDADVEVFAHDRVRRDALLWNFTVLGEAATQLSDAFKAEHAGIPWSRPIRLRNRIVHGYWSVDLDILLTTATRDLPGFVEQVRQALDESES